MADKTQRCSMDPHHDDVLFSVLDQNNIGIVLTDDHDSVVFFSRASEAIWGYRREEILGKNVSLLLPSSLHTAHPDYRSHNREGGLGRMLGRNRKLLLERKDGTRIWTCFALSKFSMSGKTGHLALVRDASNEVQQCEQSRLLLLAVDHLTIPVVVMDPERRIVQFDQVFPVICSLRRQELTGKCLDEVLIIPSSIPDNLKRLLQLLKNNVRSIEEFQIITGSGEAVWLDASLNPVFADNGCLQNLIMIFYDVTEERIVRDFGCTLLQAIGTLTPFEEFSEILCRSIERSLGGGHVRFEQTYIRAPGQHRCSVDTKSLPGCTKYELAIPLTVKQPGGVLTVHFPAGMEQNSFTERIMCISQCMTTLLAEDENSVQKIKELSQFDWLTGLPGLSHMHNFLDQLLLDTEEPAPVVFLISVDQFQDVIDCHGYTIANQVLVTVANRISGMLGPGQYLCRTEGPEFVLINRDTDLGSMMQISDMLESRVSEISSLENLSYSLTLSIGISHESGKSREWLLSTAHHAMEHAHRVGGNGRAFFSQELGRVVNERQLFGGVLKHAISDHHLRLMYQPQVNVSNGTLYGFEALIRWRDPKHGDIPPSRFIPLAEETGAIEEIDLWVLREVCRQLAEWRQRGLNIPAVSINLSARHFHSCSLPEQVLGVLEEFSVPGRQLTLEITESTTMIMDDDLLRRIHMLRNAGIGLSIDDFGTGFSGLSRLLTLPLTELKIDRCFVTGDPGDSRRRALLEAITGIGHSFDLVVIAEGVESKEQFQLLQELGCPVIQGYYFSEPIEAGDITERYRSI